MKLALRLGLAMLVPIIVLVLINGALRLGREARLIEGGSARAQARLVQALVTAIADNWATGGTVFARRLISDIGGDAAGVRFVEDISLVPAGVIETDEQRSQLRHGATVTSKQAGDTGRPIITTVAPVVVDGVVRGFVSATEVLDEEQSYLAGTVLRSVLLTALLSVVALMISLFMGVRLVGRPLEELVRQTETFGQGDLTARVDAAAATNELATLATAFNRMGAQLQKARELSEREAQARVEALGQLRHAERLTTVGRLSSGLAHELGTPLNVVIGRAELIATGEVVGAEAQENGRIIVEQSHRMSGIIRQLLDFARVRRPRPRRTDVGAVFRSCQDMLGPMAKERAATIDVALQGELFVDADGDQVEQMVINLAVNGLQAMHAGKTGTRLLLDADVVQARAAPASTQVSYVRLLVSDEGTGIPVDVQPRMFDPFFTTKDVGEGTGLGLAVIHGLVEEHQGFITFETSPRGTTFHVHLPVDATRKTTITSEEA